MRRLTALVIAGPSSDIDRLMASIGRFGIRPSRTPQLDVARAIEAHCIFVDRAMLPDAEWPTDDPRLDAVPLIDITADGSPPPARCLMQVTPPFERSAVREALRRVERADRTPRRSARPTDADPIDATIARIQRGELELPEMPDVVLRLREELGRLEGPRRQKVIEFLESDEALVTRVIKAANLVGAGITRVTTLPGAVGRLGNATVYRLVFTIEMRKLFWLHDPVLDRIFRNRWASHLASGHRCRAVARALGSPHQPEHAFLLGLMHRIGESFLLRAFDAYVQSNSSTPPEPDTIEEILSRWQPHVGAALARQWSLGPAFVAVARYSSTADGGESEGLPPDVLRCVRLVRLSESIGDALDDAETDRIACHPEVERNFELLGCPPAQRAVVLRGALDSAR